ERVGGSETIKVDVRIIAATNCDLAEEVKKGTFREDLYYRLNVVGIEMPALRERRSDIPLLVEHFLRRFAADNGKPVAGMSRAVLDVLTAYEWPGNVRELENAIERAVVMTRGDTIEPQHLPAALCSSLVARSVPLIPGSTLEEIERHAILSTLEAT